MTPVGIYTLDFKDSKVEPPPKTGEEILIAYGSRSSVSLFLVLWNGVEWADGSGLNIDDSGIQSWAHTAYITGG